MNNMNNIFMLTWNILDEKSTEGGAMLFSKYPFRRHGVLVFSIGDINWHSIVKKNFPFSPSPLKKKKYHCRPLDSYIQCTVVHYWHYYFDVQIDPDLTKASPFLLLPVSFWYASFLEHFFTFWHSKVFRTYLYFSRPSPEISFF